MALIQEYVRPSGCSVRVVTFYTVLEVCILTRHRADQQRPLRCHPLCRPRSRRTKRTKGRRPPRRRDTFFPDKARCSILHPRDPISRQDRPLRHPISMRNAPHSSDTKLHRWRDYLHEDGRCHPGQSEQRRRRAELPVTDALLRPFQPCSLGQWDGRRRSDRRGSIRAGYHVCWPQRPDDVACLGHTPSDHAAQLLRRLATSPASTYTLSSNSFLGQHHPSTRQSDRHRHRLR